jgi:proline iminopeptidase
MRDFYPEIQAFDSQKLRVSEIHEIYFEQSGNPKGKPILFLHGGPGGGLTADYRRFFDPKHYRAILLDQRGCGKSTPHAELRENTTWDLVADIEKIRVSLGIEKWHVFGGSWGSTLALAYAVTHPTRVSGLILRGIFLCRPSEIKWFYQFGASEVFPDLWEEYFNFIPREERNDFVRAYHKRLTSSDESVRMQAARIWSDWENSTAYLRVKPPVRDAGDGKWALAFARIENHYFMNNAFFATENYLLENIDKIRNIPGIIIQGRYDMVCPARSAWDLHRAWPEAKIQLIPEAGHSAAEPGIRSALIEAADNFRNI